MIISTISWGSLVAGDEGVAKTSGESRLEHVLRILARVLYQIRMTSNSITGAEI